MSNYPAGYREPPNFDDIIQTYENSIAERDATILAQQARIEEMKSVIETVVGAYDVGDISALREHDAKLLEEAARRIKEQHRFAHGASDCGDTLRRMAAEKREGK